MAPMVSLLLLLLACGTQPKSLLACKDIACKKQVATTQWKSDQDALVRDLALVTDPIEQVALVEALTEAYPGETAALCELLPEGAGRERCDRINIRPHLASRGTTTSGTGAVNTTTAASTSAVSSVDLKSASVTHGPGMTLLIPSDYTPFQTSPWDDMAVRAVTCEDEPSERACRAAAAQGYAREDKTDWAAGACAGIEAGQWRWECMFNAAEEASGRGGADHARTAYELCLGSGDYLANCFAHAAMGLAQSAPPATAATVEEWQRVIDSVAAARDTIKVRDADLADRIAERIWAEAILFAYRRVTELSGDPLDVLPPEAVPHIHAAAAWQLVSVEGDEERTLAQWGERIDEVLASRLKGKGGPVGVGTRGTPVKNLWVQLYAGEEIFEQVLYLGQAKRVRAADPSADRLVCVLEAIGRAPNRPAKLFVEALDHPNREVRWTAARLIQALDTSGLYTVQLLSKEDPLVRGRGVQISAGGMSGPGGGIPKQNTP